MIKLIDKLQSFLFVLIITLILGGGFLYQSINFKIELAQIDTFAWIFLILAFIRNKYSNGYFSNFIEKSISALTQRFNERPIYSLVLINIFYILTMSWTQFFRYDSYHANAYDLSYVDQPIWATTKISFLYSSLAIKNTYLGEHFSPILGLVAYPYALFNSVYFLFILQALTLGLSSILIFKIAQFFKINSGYSLYIVLCYFLYQPLRSANLFDFREDNFFVPLFLAILYFLLKNRFLLAVFFGFISIFVKENASIFLFLISVMLFFKPFTIKNKLIPILSCLISLIVFYIINQKVTPYFSGAEHKTRFAFRMGEYGSTSFDFILGIIKNPISFLKLISANVITKNTFKYFLVVFTPILYFARFSPISILVVLFGFLLNVLLGINTVGFHYECVLIPFVFFTLIYGFSKSKQINILILVISFLLFFGRSPIFYLWQYIPTEHEKLLTNELKKIPADVSVTTQTAIHPHISHRKNAFLLNGKPTTDYVAVSLDESIDRYGTPNLLNDLATIKETEYELITDEESKILIYKKINAPFPQK